MTDVEKEENRIIKLIEGVPEELKKANQEMIHQLAFMAVTLRDLAEHIEKNGVKEEYQNGENQFGYKETVEVKTYNNMFKNYNIALRQLNDLIPKGTTVKGDGFDGFGE